MNVSFVLFIRLWTRLAADTSLNVCIYNYFKNLFDYTRNPEHTVVPFTSLTDQLTTHQMSRVPKVKITTNKQVMFLRYGGRRRNISSRASTQSEQSFRCPNEAYSDLGTIDGKKTYWKGATEKLDPQNVTTTSFAPRLNWCEWQNRSSNILLSKTREDLIYQ